MVSMEGELWREHRRFFMQVMRNLGVGRNILEEKVLFKMLLEKCCFD